MLYRKFPALKYRDFRLWWIGQLLSNVGTQMQTVAINWHIYILTHSALALGAIGLMRVLPIVLVSMIAGSVADTYNSKIVNLIIQIILAVLSFILFLMTFLHTINPAAIYIITVLSMIAASFEMTTRQALIPNLIEKEHFTNAMSLNVLMRETSNIAGPAIAGILIAATGVAPIYLLNALSFIAVIIALILMHASGKAEGQTSGISIAAMKEGIIFIKSRSIIWSTMLLDCFGTFFAGAMTLLPIFAKDILSVGPQGLGLLYASPSIGAVIAGYFVAQKAQIRKQGKIILAAVAVYALGTIIFGFSKSFILSCLALFLIGAGDSVSTIIRNTIRQLNTPDNMRGRMVAINMVFFMGGPQLGEFEAGLLAAYIGAPLSVVIGGIGALLVVTVIGIAIPKLRNYDK